MKRSTAFPDWRFKFFTYVLFFAYAVILLRLFQIQVINASKYKAQAREQQWKGVTLDARRGNIYTSDGYPVAGSTVEYSLFVDTYELPEEYKDADRLYGDLLAVYPEIDSSKVIQAVELGRRWFRMAGGLSIDQKAAVMGLEIDGLSFAEEYSRFYPEEKFLSHVLGFVGKNADGEPVGYYGIEQFYDGDLKGQEGWLLQERSALGDPILWGGLERIDPVNGNDAYLTIDRKVQYMLETKLESAVKGHAAISGSAIVVHPSTGRIIALANYPDFDLKKYDSDLEDSNIYRNAAVSTIYEPGSVMKAITTSAGIDSGSIEVTSVYHDNGPRIFSGHKVDNWDGKHHGDETITEILQHSNNLGAAWIGMQTGDKVLVDYLAGFGFGGRLGIDIDGEESGILYTNFPLKDIEVANASFGQGISATPLQVVMAFSAIANDGLLMKPYVVEKIVHSDTGKETYFKPEVLNRAISTSTAEVMNDLLTKAVSGGEAQFFVSKKYNIAGKTGTAQVPRKGGYDEKRTNATFAGYFPSYKNFVMLVKLEEPTWPSGYAAETAVPVWMDIAEDLAAYYSLAPDKNGTADN